MPDPPRAAPRAAAEPRADDPQKVCRHCARAFDANTRRWSVCNDCIRAYAQRGGQKGTKKAERTSNQTTMRQQAEMIDRLRAELATAKAAHQYTLDMERPCARLLSDLNQIVKVPDGSSLKAEVQRLTTASAALQGPLQAILSALTEDMWPCSYCGSDTAHRPSAPCGQLAALVDAVDPSGDSEGTRSTRV